MSGPRFTRAPSPFLRECTVPTISAIDVAIITNYRHSCCHQCSAFNYNHSDNVNHNHNHIDNLHNLHNHIHNHNIHNLHIYLDPAFLHEHVHPSLRAGRCVPTEHHPRMHQRHGRLVQVGVRRPLPPPLPPCTHALHNTRNMRASPEHAI